MFIIPSNPHPDTKATLNVFKAKFGSVPPHFALLATVNPKRFEIFVQEILYLAMHTRIDSDFFAFLRLFIASKEGFAYCLNFNTELLLAKGYGNAALQAVKKDINNIPLDERHCLLANMALKAMYEAEAFGVDDIAALNKAGWEDADIYDAIDHAAFLFKNARVIKAYSQN